MDAKNRNRREHFAARQALFAYREHGDTSGFPDLQKRAEGFYGLNLSGFRDEDVNPRLTQEEYAAFKAAYEASDEGKAARAEFEVWLRKIREE
jgi:hypothetical protein